MAGVPVLPEAQGPRKVPTHLPYVVERGRPGEASEVAATLLLALDGLEEGLEVALAETERAVPLDQLEEHGGPVADRPGEDLQQVAVLVAVDQDAAALQVLDRHPDVADPGPQLGVL